MTAPAAVAPELDADEQALVAGVPQALADGEQLLAWWQRAHAAGSFAQRFPLVRDSRPADASYGFFDTVELASGPLPVMGVYQEMFFDRSRGAPPRGMRDQLREFVLRYFMRVSDFQVPVVYVPERPAPYLPGLSWCPQREDGRRGFGYNQLYFQRASDGLIGRFPEAVRTEIVDLREIGPRFDWIVVDVDIFDFTLDFAPLGQRYPYLRVPLQEHTLLVLAPPYVVAEDDPEPGLLGRYGLGYALLRDPKPSVLAYGPGQFSAGFQTIDFKITDEGVARACLVFVVNRPEQLLNLSYNPFAWGLELTGLAASLFAPRLAAPLERLAPSSERGFDPIFTFITLANLATAGRAAADLCISRESLERQMLVQHFIEHFNLIEGAMATWRRPPSWLDAAALPEWVRTGRRP